MSNPFVNSSFTESTEVEVHQATSSDAAATDGQTDVQSPETKNTIPGTSWVQFDENGDEVRQPLKSEATGEYVQLQLPPPRSNRQVPPNGQVVASSISSSGEPKREDTNYATIELSHSIEISHPASAIPKQQPQQLSSTVGGSHLKVNNVASTSLSALPKSPSPSVASSSNGTNHSSNALSHFANGDIIVTLLPLNEGWDWVTPAKFKAHLVPEELMAQSLTLTVEDYVTNMSVLFSDYRFNFYIVFYKRVLGLWISLSILILLCILFSGWIGLPLFIAGMIWLLTNALGIFAAIYIKQKLYRMLEEAIGQVNAVFSKHNIFLGLDDRGRYSCHKVELVFVYFDAKYCIKFLQDMLNNSEQRVNSSNSDGRLNNNQGDNHHQQAMITLSNTMQCIDTSDIIITGSTPRRLSQKEKYADKLLLRYSQRWIREYNRERMELNPKPTTPNMTNTAVATSSSAAGNGDGSAMMMNNQQPHPQSPTATPTSTLPSPSVRIPMAARHCRGHKCFCQFIEEHLKYKPVTTCSMLSELCRS